MRFFLLCILCCSLCVEAEEPIFAGPFLAYPASTYDPGKGHAESYLLYGRIPGSYNTDGQLTRDRNAHFVEGFGDVRFGLIPNVDIELDLYADYARNSGKETVQFGDITLLLGFQILHDRKGEWTPDFKVILTQFFPTGNYENLDPVLRGASITGEGVYATFPIIAFSKVLYFWPHHPCLWTLNLAYGIPMSAKVNGGNVFTGPTPDVRGTVSPGVFSFIDLAFECKITRTLSWTMEALYNYQNSGSFVPSVPTGPTPDVTSSSLLNLAPGFGVVLTSDLTLLASLWLTVAGRNNLAFSSGAVFMTYSY